MNAIIRLQDHNFSYVMPYAFWFDALEPGTGLPVPGVGSHRFYRFYNRVPLHKMTIRRPADARGGRPERMKLFAYQDKEPQGTVIYDGPVEWKDDLCEVQFKDLQTFAVSQLCDWTTPSRVTDLSEYHVDPWCVPFSIFDETSWWAERGNDREWLPGPEVNPFLEQGTIAPRGQERLKARFDGRCVHYESPAFQVGFNVLRPRISHLGWDFFGSGLAAKNLLADLHTQYCSGPWCLNLAGPGSPFLWGGKVEVEDNVVRYSSLTYDRSFFVGVEFHVRPDGMDIVFDLEVKQKQKFLEAELWRLVFDGSQAYSIGTLARPIRGNHRNGLVEAKGGWHCTGQGTLRFESQDEGLSMQVDNYGFSDPKLFCGFQMGVERDPYGPVTLKPGHYRAALSLRVGNLEPVYAQDTQPEKVHRGLRRAWGTIFAFRPEHGGFSNNSFSTNCQNVQHLVADMMTYSVKNDLFSLTDLFKYNIDLALRGGPGYGCRHERAPDAPPSLVYSAGQIYRTTHDRQWVESRWPFLERLITHMLGNIDETGMYTCFTHSGNAYSYGSWTIAYDTLSFGHYDGYTAALAYPAFHCAAALAGAVGRKELQERCLTAATGLKNTYEKVLFNPETGWLGAWRSQDGELHDYGLICINAMAVCFGLIEGARAKGILDALVNRIGKMGLSDYRYGIPFQLIPMPQKDWAFRRLGGRNYLFPFRRDGADTFGVYLNGCVSPNCGFYFLKALSQHGFKALADRICDDLLDSFDRMRFDGHKNGVEFFTWDGTPCGYEGTLVHDFHVLLAIAQHKGWVEPAHPEFWPKP